MQWHVSHVDWQFAEKEQAPQPTDRNISAFFLNRLVGLIAYRVASARGGQRNRQKQRTYGEYRELCLAVMGCNAKEKPMMLLVDVTETIKSTVKTLMPIRYIVKTPSRVTTKS